MRSQNDIPTEPPPIIHGRDGCYTLEGRLSGQNPIFLARLIDGSPCVVKEYRLDTSYRRERYALDTLQKAGGHPNILCPLEYIEGQAPRIVFSFLPGGTLLDYLVQNETLDERESAMIFSPLCDAMQTMHEQGLVHRDIKASNILLEHDKGCTKIGNGCGISPYLCDFDVAYHKDIAHLDSGSLIIGTPTHIAPELWEGATPDARSDIYALGVTLSTAMTGKIPFRGGIVKMMRQHRYMPVPDPAHVNKGVSEGMRAIIMRCLQKDPGDRYQSAADLKPDIEGLR